MRQAGLLLPFGVCSPKEHKAAGCSLGIRSLPQGLPCPVGICGKGKFIAVPEVGGIPGRCGGGQFHGCRFQQPDALVNTEEILSPSTQNGLTLACALKGYCLLGLQFNVKASSEAAAESTWGSGGNVDDV